MKQFFIQIIFVTLVLVALSSCSSSKEMGKAQEKDPAQSSSGPQIDNTTVQQVFIDAIKAKILEDYEQAEKLFEKCIRLDAKNHAAMYELATIYFASGKYDLAYQYVKKAVDIDDTNKWYLILYSEVLSYKGQFADAAAVYEKLVRANPKEFEFYFDWAFMLIKAEKYDQAIKVYDEYENKIGLDENVIIQKQRLYIRLNKIDKAANELQKLIETFPSDTRYYKMLADLYEANNMSDKASKIYEKLLNIDKNDPNALLYLADMYRTKGDHEQSMMYLKQAFRNPDLNIDAKVRILFPYLQNLMAKDDEKKEEAFTLALIVIEAHPDEAKSHAIYGDLLYQDKQMEEALGQYKLALELDSSVFEIWQQMFFINSELKQFDDLINITESALELFPNQPLIYFFNGLAHNQLKSYKEAIEILTIGESIVVDNPLLQAQINASLGDAYNSIENYALSDSAFEKSLILDPDNSYVLNNYSYYLSLRNVNLERASEMSARANEMEPDNAAFQDTYAWILYKQAKYEIARKWIEKSLESGGNNNPVILEHYGDILFKLGEVDKAVIYWEKAKSIGSESELIGRKIADRKIYE